MKTALDSSVILDVLTDDPDWAGASESALQQASAAGTLIVCECVIAEITPALPSGMLASFLTDWGIRYLPSTQESSEKAGEMFRRYLERRTEAKRVLPDFLIGAHAQLHAGRLLARDRGYYRDYFSELTLIEPK